MQAVNVEAVGKSFNKYNFRVIRASNVGLSLHNRICYTGGEVRKMITIDISAAAVERIKELQQLEGKEHHGARIYVLPG